MKRVQVGGKSYRINGWRPDRPDKRDKLLLEVPGHYMPMPPHVDLGLDITVVEDQGDIGSCVAHAATTAMESLFKKQGLDPPQLSRLFAYYATRVWVEGDDPEDDVGCEIRNAMKALARYGACHEETWPYDIEKYAECPPGGAVQEALTHRILVYKRCETLSAVMRSLADGYPVVFGFSVHEGMMSDECALTGKIKMPRYGERVIGGHAMLATGYDMATKELRVRNSWSRTWGQGGDGFLPFGYFEEELADDAWTIRSET